jgi:hypothetical protein
VRERRRVRELSDKERKKLKKLLTRPASLEMAGNFRLNWSNLCTRVQDLDSARVKLARVSGQLSRPTRQLTMRSSNEIA